MRVDSGMNVKRKAVFCAPGAEFVDASLGATTEAKVRSLVQRTKSKCIDENAAEKLLRGLGGRRSTSAKRCHRRWRHSQEILLPAPTMQLRSCPPKPEPVWHDPAP